ncbi:MAG TPA: cobalt-precorrin-5B (C(1))-methyltransferase [Rhodospirillales bacterium]
MAKLGKGALRRGFTTGACATAAARAAAEALLTGRFPDPVTIALPKGERPSFPLACAELIGDRATAGVVKDAGDDPDVTHGALILASVIRGAAGSGVTFRAGEGVGTITRAGLPLPVGEPAINPVPRRMIAQTIAEALAAQEKDGNPPSPDFEVTVSVPGGAALAEKTLNRRLGIVGGLSILGTTGIVIPYSCSSWIHSIHRGIDVARAAGLSHIAASTGRTSERTVQKLYDLPEVALIDMGDFVGGTLKYLRNHAVPRVTLAGGFAKMSKLASGHLDLHSGTSRLDSEVLARMLEDLGARELAAAARNATSGGEILALAQECGVDLASLVARRAREVALAALGGGVNIDVVVCDRDGRAIGRAGP